MSRESSEGPTLCLSLLLTKSLQSEAAVYLIGRLLDMHRVLAPYNLGVVACDCNPRTRVVEAEGQILKVIVGYISSTRTT